MGSSKYPAREGELLIKNNCHLRQKNNAISTTFEPNLNKQKYGRYFPHGRHFFSKLVELINGHAKTASLSGLSDEK